MTDKRGRWNFPLFLFNFRTCPVLKYFSVVFLSFTLYTKVQETKVASLTFSYQLFRESVTCAVVNFKFRMEAIFVWPN